MAIVTDLFLARQRRFLTRILRLFQMGHPTRCRRALIRHHGLMMFGLFLGDPDAPDSVEERTGKTPDGCFEPPRHSIISPALLCVTPYVASRLTDIRALGDGSPSWPTVIDTPGCPTAINDQGGDSDA